MSREQEIKENRLQKADRLRESGMDPYLSVSRRDMTLEHLDRDFDTLHAQQPDQSITIAGRIMSMRGAGKIAFVQLFDGSGRFQVVCRCDDLGEESMKFFSKNFDIGDFVQFTGTLGLTKSEEHSLFATSYTMLTKSLLPLPDEHYGLSDEETRYRKRYLDILMNKPVRAMLERKGKFWQTVRSFLIDEGFYEIETPTLEVSTGGAEARPFKTYHNDFNLDVYLRISVGELWHKRLLAAGFDKTFEIGRVYRNEGSSPEHLQEFTNCELYWAYADYRDGMKMVQKLYQTIAEQVYGTTQFTTRGHSFDLSQEWKELEYCACVQEMTGIDVLTATESEMKAKLEQLQVTFQGDNRERLIDSLWKYCRQQISGPVFLINHPSIVSPLSKLLPENNDLVGRFQPIIAGSEVGNGFSELNDPVEQQRRFDLQKQLLDRGDEEAMMADPDFVQMLEHGMPPACGYGFGERLFAFFEDLTTREIQTFPLVKPICNQNKQKRKELPETEHASGTLMSDGSIQ